MNKRKVALITGITGQDGSYLSELLIEKGYEVHGLIRKSSSCNKARILHLLDDITLHYGDVSDSFNLLKVIKNIKPTEVYNLAGQSHVKVSFEKPEYTTDVNALGCLRLLEAIKLSELDIKFYQASSSEIFGNTESKFQNEKANFAPKSPYGIAKLAAYFTTKIYRESYNIFAANGILFNHESPRKDKMGVGHKITSTVARIHNGSNEVLKLGNLNAKRDWGYSKDYVEAMWKILQHKEADDFVIATGVSHSVRDFAEEAFKAIGINIKWQGKDENEIGICSTTGKTYVQIDLDLFRPIDVHHLKGDSSKAKELLDWEPKTSFKELVEKMVKEDIRSI
ncbi:MAG: GDP-mannose 4,6-dehydratase [Alphaproteobacteria bacterium]|nr:GDP-mannose 4,6-dehydratase [Alphaproteobacteria bacterium]